MSALAILCVDDEAIQLLALKRELVRAFARRFVVETAPDADKALNLMASLEADGASTFLLITDWLMPGMKGDELIRQARTRYPSLRAIMITGQADEEAKRRCLETEGVLGIFDKPWDRAALLSMVERSANP